MRMIIGVVSNNNDPEKRGRVMVGFQDILGHEDNQPEEYPDWVEPLLFLVGKNKAGSFFPPNNGSKVLVLMNSSDPDLIEDVWAVYLGGMWDQTGVHDTFKENYTKRFGFITPEGHQIYCDDFAGSELIDIKHKDGTEILIKDGKIYLGAETGASRLVRYDEMLTLFNDHTHPVTGVEPGAATVTSSPPGTGMSSTQATSKVYGV